MTLDNKIQTTVREEIRKGGFSGSYKIRQMSKKPHISGLIQKFDQIEIGYNPEYEQMQKGALPVMARDVARHEINHKKYKGFSGCPRNLENHVNKIYEPISDVLESTRKGFSPTDAHYVANCFADSILQADFGEKFALEGIVEFFSDVGRSAGNKQYTPFYDAHVKLNMLLWGNKKQKKKLRKYFVHDKQKQEQISKVVQGFLKKSGLSELGRSRQKVRAFLNDENTWRRIARAYAEEFSQLMEPSYALQIINHSGKGTFGRGSEGQKGVVEGNEFDREMETERYKMKRVQRGYKSGDKKPSLMDSFEALDLLYQSIVKQLKLIVETYTEAEQRPVFWHGQRPFDPDRDNLRHITFGFNDEGKVELRKKRYAETIKIPFKISPKGFPETRFCLLDTSGTMQQDPEGGDNIGRTGIIPWGDNSKYHYALLGWYGLLEYLKQNHLLNQTTISLGNFSDKTIISHGLVAAKKNALSPQFGRTVIDVSKIQEIFKGIGSLVYTISDGEIQNWSSIKNEFIKKAKEHYYFHLQIGPGNVMTKDLEKNGLEVVEIYNAQDLANKIIEITDSSFRRQ